jgi:peptide/nickel transport system permease protein
MWKYIIRRIILTFPTIFLVLIIIFAMMRLIPGDAALLMAAGDEDIRANYEIYEALRHEMGLDRPIAVQFGDYVWRFVRYGDLGSSFWSDVPVMGQILSAMPITLELAIGATLIGVTLAIPWGVVAAIRQDQMGDYVPRVASVALLSAPSFWVGTLLIVIPAFTWGYLPALGYVSIFEDPFTNIQQFMFAWLALGTRLIGTTLRMTRSSMLEVLNQDYIRTARAKGLRERAVVYRHALKNSMIPVVTVIGGQLGTILGGSIIIESLFGLPGLGLLTIESIRSRDLPQVQGCLMVLALIVVLVNLVTDLYYSWLDPRIRYN